MTVLTKSSKSVQHTNPGSCMSKNRNSHFWTRRVQHFQTRESFWAKMGKQTKTKMGKSDFWKNFESHFVSGLLCCPKEVCWPMQQSHCTPQIDCSTGDCSIVLETGSGHPRCGIGCHPVGAAADPSHIVFSLQLFQELFSKSIAPAIWVFQFSTSGCLHFVAQGATVGFLFEHFTISIVFSPAFPSCCSAVHSFSSVPFCTWFWCLLVCLLVISLLW